MNEDVVHSQYDYFKRRSNISDKIIRIGEFNKVAELTINKLYIYIYQQRENKHLYIIFITALDITIM